MTTARLVPSGFGESVWRYSSCWKCSGTSELENLHAGTVPDSEAGDYLDVIVKTPYGEIRWRDLSRFDNAEMKKLLIDVVNRTYGFIHRLFDEETGGELLPRRGAKGPVPQWDTPTLPPAKKRSGR